MKTLVAGWFSFEEGHATAGDLLAAELACEWLERFGSDYDIAVDPPFSGGINWRLIDPKNYSLVVFVCGPFEKGGELDEQFLAHFTGCRLIGLDLSMRLPLDVWNPFDFLLERDSPSSGRPDITFLSRQKLVPVVGVCRVENYSQAMNDVANAAIDRLIASREMSVVEIDTRLDVNSTGLRTPAEIESLLARMDVVITTRLHGTVLALKNGVPTISIDAEPGGAKIRRQTETIGWEVMFTVDSLSDEALHIAFDYCLTEDARVKAKECRERATKMVEEIRDEFITALARFSESDSKDMLCATAQTNYSEDSQNHNIRRISVSNRLVNKEKTENGKQLRLSWLKRQIKRIAQNILPIPVRRWLLFQWEGAAK